MEEVSPEQVPSNLHFPRLQPEGAALRRKERRWYWLAQDTNSGPH